MGPGRRALAKVVTAAVSLAFVGFGGAYLATPAQTAFAIKVEAVSARLPARTVVVYGEAMDYRDKPVKAVRITVTRNGRTLLSTSSRFDGTFRKSARLRRSATYGITVSRKHNGDIERAKKSVRLRPRRAYRVTIKLVRSGGLVLVPVRGY